MRRRVWSAASVGLCGILLAACASTTSADRPVSAPRAAVELSSAALGTPARVQARDPIWVRIHHMSLIDRVRQLMVPEFSGTGVPTSLIQALHPGGLIYFGDNLTTQAQTKALSGQIQRATRGHTLPMLIMTDQEGGTVTRIPGTEDTPGGIDFHGNAPWARATAISTGRLMSNLGVNTNLAPDADVNKAGSSGFFTERSFGSTPAVVSRLVTAQVCGYHVGGIATTVKHFPGLGSTTINTEIHTAVIKESVTRWTNTDLPPFQAAVNDNVDMILVGHVAFPAMDPSGRPATISWKLNHVLLRDRLGYQGVVITDALNMGGITSWGTNAQIAVEAFQAGNDMLLMPPQPTIAIQAVWHAVLSGQITEGRLDMSVYRILKLKQTLGLLMPPKSLPQC